MDERKYAIIFLLLLITKCFLDRKRESRIIKSHYNMMVADITAGNVRGIRKIPYREK